MNTRESLIDNNETKPEISGSIMGLAAASTNLPLNQLFELFEDRAFLNRIVKSHVGLLLIILLIFGPSEINAQDREPHLGDIIQTLLSTVIDDEPIEPLPQITSDQLLREVVLHLGLSVNWGRDPISYGDGQNYVLLVSTSGRDFYKFHIGDGHAEYLETISLEYTPTYIRTIGETGVVLFGRVTSEGTMPIELLNPTLPLESGAGVDNRLQLMYTIPSFRVIVGDEMYDYFVSSNSLGQPNVIRISLHLPLAVERFGLSPSTTPTSREFIKIGNGEEGFMIRTVEGYVVLRVEGAQVVESETIPFPDTGLSDYDYVTWNGESESLYLVSINNERARIAQWSHERDEYLVSTLDENVIGHFIDQRGYMVLETVSGNYVVLSSDVERHPTGAVQILTLEGGVSAYFPSFVEAISEGYATRSSGGNGTPPEHRTNISPHGVAGAAETVPVAESIPISQVAGVQVRPVENINYLSYYTAPGNALGIEQHFQLDQGPLEAIARAGDLVLIRQIRQSGLNTKWGFVDRNSLDISQESFLGLLDSFNINFGQTQTYERSPYLYVLRGAAGQDVRVRSDGNLDSMALGHLAFVVDFVRIILEGGNNINPTSNLRRPLLIHLTGGQPMSLIGANTPFSAITVMVTPDSYDPIAGTYRWVPRARYRAGTYPQYVTLVGAPSDNVLEARFLSSIAHEVAHSLQEATGRGDEYADIVGNIMEHLVRGTSYDALPIITAYQNHSAELGGRVGAITVRLQEYISYEVYAALQTRFSLGNN